MKGYIAVGLTAIAGAALIEAVLVPGLVIGGAAMLAPAYLPSLKRRIKPIVDAVMPNTRKPRRPASPPPAADTGTSLLARLGAGRAVAKTITFRIIVTTLDFTTNYVVIGELTTAAGLSTFNLVVGPVFYLSHEAIWNYLGPPDDAGVDVVVPAAWPGGTIRPDGQKVVAISRALAKTITFRTIATIMDFATNYVVVRDVATAAGLSAFAFVVGPFVYIGHEKLWDYYGGPGPADAPEPKPVKLLTAQV
jgi:uncharacterized membrane protein